MKALTSERAKHADVVSINGRMNVLPLDQLRTVPEVIGILCESLERERCRADRAEAAEERLERRLAAAEDQLTEAESKLAYERGRVDQADRAAVQLGELWDQTRREIATVDHARREAEAALCAAKTCEEALKAELATLKSEVAALKEGPRISRTLRRITAARWPSKPADAHNTRRRAQTG